jgi:hypothetical protein
MRRGQDAEIVGVSVTVSYERLQLVAACRRRARRAARPTTEVRMGGGGLWWGGPSQLAANA